MRKICFLLLLFLLISLSLPFICFAKTGWVSDVLFLKFKEGPGDNFKSTKILKSNTPFEILEEKNRFYKIKLQSNEIGWVNKKFILLTKPKSLLTTQVQQENKKLLDEIVKLESRAQKLKQANQSLRDEFTHKIQKLKDSLNVAMSETKKQKKAFLQSEKKYKKLTEQSKNVLSIIEQKKALQAANKTIQEQLDKVEISFLKGKNKIKWFIAGATVLLLGWFIGFLSAPKKRNKGLLLN